LRGYVNKISKWLLDHPQIKELLTFAVVITAILVAFFIGNQMRMVTEYNCYQPTSNDPLTYGMPLGPAKCYPDNTTGMCPYQYNDTAIFRTSPRLEIEIPK
jgi:hypothetical protein